MHSQAGGQRVPEWRPQMRLFTALAHNFGVSTRAVASVCAQLHWVRADIEGRQGSNAPQLAVAASI